MNPFLRVGVITKTHGLKGEMKVFPTTDSPLRFADIKRVIIRSRNNTSTAADKVLYIERVKYFKKQVILKFKNIDSVSDAGRYRGSEIYIPREEGVILEEGEHYIADIIDMNVVDGKGSRIGRVRDVLETGANDVYIIRREDNGKDLLLPAIKECILKVDIENNEMTIHIMDGLMDL